MAETVALERRYALTCIAGSNPAPSAKVREKTMSARTKMLTVTEAQITILQWLRRLGHGVEFREFVFSPELPGAPSKPVARTTPLAPWYGKPCPYCGMTMEPNTRHMPSRDHKKPRVHGGTLAGDNKLVVGKSCNGDKGARTLEQWLRWLTKKGDPRAHIIRELIECGG